MNTLESRKKLLLAESELNRAQLAGDLAALKTDVRALTNRARSISSIFSSAAMVLAGLAAFRRGKSADPGAKTSWLKTIVKGAGMISTFWLAFRSQSRCRDEA